MPSHRITLTSWKYPIHSKILLSWTPFQIAGTAQISLVHWTTSFLDAWIPKVHLLACCTEAINWTCFWASAVFLVGFVRTAHFTWSLSGPLFHFLICNLNHHLIYFIFICLFSLCSSWKVLGQQEHCFIQTVPWNLDQFCHIVDIQ